MTKKQGGYGGDATIEKLDALQRYADLFTKVLRDKPSPDEPFTLEYVDAFAGRGTVTIQRGAYAGKTVSGSAQIALEIEDRRFDRLLFIDNVKRNVEILQELIDSREDQDRASVWHGDANDLLPQFCSRIARADHRMHRALVFIDPFDTKVDWATIEAVAATERVDVLLLIPLMAVRRLVKRDGFPESRHATALDRIFGDDSWRGLYSTSGAAVFSDDGFRDIVNLYVARLNTVFVRVVDPKRALGSPGEPTMFTLIGAASNPDAADLVDRLMRGTLAVAHGPQLRMELC